MDFLKNKVQMTNIYYSPDGKMGGHHQLGSANLPEGKLVRSIDSPCDHHGHLDFAIFA